MRYNGGGWTTDYLMAVLNVEQHAYTIPRGATDNLDKDHQIFTVMITPPLFMLVSIPVMVVGALLFRLKKRPKRYF